MTNVVVLQGRLSKPVAERVLPSGDRLAVLDLTVPAEETRPAGSLRAESVPLAWFEAPAWALELDTGAELVVMGRVRRRFFRAGQQLQSRTEVVVELAAPARRPARVADLVATAAEVIAGVSGRRRSPATFP
jgi:single-strand DNA-binding protein